ncbi:TetR/AcrR family transcriptional regulator [Corynebacterium atypicum]|uniref:TetR/AcrR family transcriptional regulator n=1 Tax=Corynebacterium atypicum TaxID=191610 RepID=UPI0013767B0A|nr:TetR/AcrR family transcriptional regulator [Corynebacterium atypicum]
MGLRETKKAATRAAMSEAAARIALTDGVEGLTVAAIARAAEVSTRTFHNYFAFREEPLIEYLAGQVHNITQQLVQIPLNVCIVEAAEQLLCAAVRRDETDFANSMGSLFRLADFLENSAGHNVQSTIQRELEPLMDNVQARHPHLGRYEASVVMQLLSTTAVEALEEYYQNPSYSDPEEGVELIHRAFRVLRLMGAPHHDKDSIAATFVDTAEADADQEPKPAQHGEETEKPQER